jgi:hypothetical protein
MPSRRVLVSMELISPEGFRIQFDDNGWHLLNRRQLGEAQRELAFAVVERAEEVVYPVDEKILEPPTLQQIGEYAAKIVGLRITHQRFKQK